MEPEKTKSKQKNMNPLMVPGISHREMDSTVKNNDFFDMGNLLYPDLKRIGQIVANYYGLEPWHLKWNTRKKTVVQARQIAMYFATALTHHSLTRIGSYFAGRDHSTVFHARKTISDLYEVDRTVRRDIDTLHNTIHSNFSAERIAIYDYRVDHQAKQIQIQTNSCFNYGSFRKLVDDLNGEDIDRDYNLIII